MKKINALTLLAGALVIAACHSSKKSKAPVAAATPAPPPAAPATPSSTNTAKTTFYMAPGPRPKSGNNAYPPGEPELTAIQAEYKEVTLEHLNEGYTLYTKGACIGCHEAFNIYNSSATRWKTIIDDMANRAMLSDRQKDAVYKYVLAIKATQPK